MQAERCANSPEVEKLDRITFSDEFLTSVLQSRGSFCHNIKKDKIAMFPEVFYELSDPNNLGRIISTIELKEKLGMSSAMIRVNKGYVNRVLEGMETPVTLQIYTLYKRGLVLLPELKPGKYHDVSIISSDQKLLRGLEADEAQARRRVDTMLKVTSEKGKVVSMSITPIEEAALDIILSRGLRVITYGDMFRLMYGDDADEVAKKIDEGYTEPNEGGERRIFANSANRKKIINRPRDIIKKMKSGLDDIEINFEVSHLPAYSAKDKRYKLTEFRVRQ